MLGSLGPGPRGGTAVSLRGRRPPWLARAQRPAAPPPARPGAAGIEVAPVAGEPQHRERGRREAVRQRLPRAGLRELLDQQRHARVRARPAAGAAPRRGRRGRRPAACPGRRRTPRPARRPSRRTPRPGGRPPRSGGCAPTASTPPGPPAARAARSHSPAATASRWPRAVSSRARSAFPGDVLGLGVAQQDEGPVGSLGLMAPASPTTVAPRHVPGRPTTCPWCSTRSAPATEDAREPSAWRAVRPATRRTPQAGRAPPHRRPRECPARHRGGRPHRRRRR